MSQKSARNSLKKYLANKTSVLDDLIFETACEHLEKIAKLSSSETKITNEIIDKYIVDHYPELNAEAHSKIEEISKEVIPERQAKHLLFQFGVLAIFLLPPCAPPPIIYPNYLSLIIQNGMTDTAGFASCIIGLLFLLGLIIASAFAVLSSKLS